MQQSLRPVDHLRHKTQADLIRATRQPLVLQAREGRLSRRDYELLLWGLRGFFGPNEALIWASKAPALCAAREAGHRKVPLLERDLVALCGTRLVVPASLNRFLDEVATRATPGATTGRLLGRTFAHEQLCRRLAEGAAGVQAALGTAPDGAPAGVTHLLQAYVCVSADPGSSYDQGLVGSVLLQNALDGAHEMYAQFDDLVAELSRHQAPSAVAI